MVLMASVVCQYLSLRGVFRTCVVKDLFFKYLLHFCEVNCVSLPFMFITTSFI